MTLVINLVSYGAVWYIAGTWNCPLKRGYDSINSRNQTTVAQWMANQSKWHASMH